MWRAPGVEEQGLFVVDEVLVEGEPGRTDFGDEGREPVDAVGDLADVGVHCVLLFGLGWVGSRVGWVGDQRGRGWRRMPVPVAALGQDPAELDGVHRDVLATAPARNCPPAGPPSVEDEGLAVGARPFGDDVGDEPAVVVGIEVERLAGRPRQVDAVHPDVAGEADVEEVGDRLAPDRRRKIEQRETGDRARQAGPRPQRPG